MLTELINHPIDLAAIVLVVLFYGFGILCLIYIGIKALIQHIIDNSSYENKVRALRKKIEEL